MSLLKFVVDLPGQSQVVRHRLNASLLRPAPVLAFLAVVWLNAYICRELFTVETTARMNSMHGFWAAIAHWADSAWWTPTWWPFWDAGMPFEYTYAPGIPALIALIARITGGSELRALNIVMGLVYVLGPAALYTSLWMLTRSVSWSFASAAVYSLLSPALLLAPHQRFSISNLFTAERLGLISGWDETPHLAALALWPFAVLCLLRILETRRWKWIAAGALVMAAMVYLSAFGAMLLALSALSALGAFGFSGPGMISLGIAGALTYLAACIAMPPSLMKFIRTAAESHGEGWSVATLTSLAFLGLVWTLLLPWLHRRVHDLLLRFFVLFTTSSLYIVWMFLFLGRSIIPQPGRYRVELSLGLAVSCVFALRPLWKRCARPVQVAILALLLTLAAEEAVDQRRWAKAVLRERNLAETIEHRAATWMDAHLDPDARVMLPGSMAQWMNSFSHRPQWGGGAWSTAPNPEQQRAMRAVFEEQGAIDGSLTWFRAFAVQGVVMSGNQSPEFWKPFVDKTKYDGKLPILWREADTSLYGVSLHNASLAHALPQAARSTSEWNSVKRYVAALDTERLPGLAFRWAGRNRAVVKGEVLGGEAVSIQMTHHPGWTATVNGKPAPLQRDGIGLIWLNPSCNGPCAIELSYNGGLELILCRIMSLVALAGLSALLVWSYRTDAEVRWL